MFGLFGKKYKKQADIIGAVLHEQIIDAVKENEERANLKLQTPFFSGYFIAFVKSGFNCLDIPMSEAENYYEYICDGIYPNKLYKIYIAQLGLVQQTKVLSKVNAFEKEFKLGGKVGLWDGNNLILWNNRACRTNLKSYLLNQKLDYLEE